MTTALGDPAQERESAALVGAWRVVRERWPIVLAAVVVCLTVVLGFSLTATKQYSSTASLLFRQSDLTTLVDPTVASGRDAQRDQGTNLLLVQSSAVAQRVKAALR